MSTTSSEQNPAHPCSPIPSVGIVAARLPGRGKLRHHLGLLCSDVEA